MAGRSKHMGKPVQDLTDHELRMEYSRCYNLSKLYGSKGLSKRFRLIEKRFKEIENEKNQDLVDPQELDPKYHEIFESVNLELEKQFHNVKKYMGFCYFYWEEKKAILWKKYGIVWKTPAEMNPNTLYD